MYPSIGYPVKQLLAPTVSQGGQNAETRSMDLSIFLDALIERERAQTDSGDDISPILTPPSTPGDAPDERYPETNVTVGDKQLRVMVANTPAGRAIGLSNLDDGLGDYQGLLMSWPSDARASLTNRNVNFPVAAAYFDSSGMYRDSQMMQANDPIPRHARVQHRHILEVHQKDWDDLGIGPGSQLSLAAEKDRSRNGSINPDG